MFRFAGEGILENQIERRLGDKLESMMGERNSMDFMHTISGGIVGACEVIMVPY